MTTEQQAVETKVDEQSKTAAETSNDAQNESLDDLLKEWDSDEKPNEQPKAEAKKTEKPESDEDDAVLRQYVRDQMQKEINTAYKETIKSIKGDLPVSDKVIDGYLRVKASEDPRVLRAYQNRHTAPAAWEKVEKAIQKEIRDEINALPDKGATETRKAVMAAVSNTKTATPEPAKNLGSMSNREFEEAKRKAFGIQD